MKGIHEIPFEQRPPLTISREAAVKVNFFQKAEIASGCCGCEPDQKGTVLNDEQERQFAERLGQPIYPLTHEDVPTGEFVVVYEKGDTQTQSTVESALAENFPLKDGIRTLRAFLRRRRF